MYRGTTPTLTFTLPFETSLIEKLCLGFAQKGAVILEKHLEDFTLNGKQLSLKLSEQDTLSFDASETWVEMQFRVLIGGSVSASKIMKTEVQRIICEEVLSDV